MARLSVTLFQPLQTSRRRQLLSEWQFGVREVQAEFTTAIDCGFDTATVRAPAVFEEVPLGTLLVGRADIEPFAHVEIRLGTQVVWLGRVTSYLMDRLRLAGFTATGYGRQFDDRAWSGAAGTALGVLRQVLREVAPFIDLGPDSLVHDPSFTLTADQTRRLFLHELIQMVNKHGSVQGFPVACQIWDGPLMPQLVIVPRTPPREADIVIPPRDPGLQIDDIDLTQLTNLVTVTSGDQTTRVPANDAEVDYATLRVIRETDLQMEAGTSASQRTAYARSVLASYGAIRVSGRWQTWGDVLTPSGATVPAHTVRAGMWALLPGVGTLQIMRTTYRWPDQVLEVQFGALSPDERAARMYEDVAVSAYRRLSPLTWLRV